MGDQELVVRSILRLKDGSRYLMGASVGEVWSEWPDRVEPGAWIMFHTLEVLDGCVVKGCTVMVPGDQVAIVFSAENL